MFKKNISVVQTRPLSGKDGKKLRKDVEKLYPTLPEEDLKRLFPTKADISLMKLSNKATAYSCSGGNPLFFDPTGREDVLIPTVYALWLCPRMLPSLYTYSEVSPKVLGGADLFLQGLIVPDFGLGTFAAGDLRVASIPQNEFPFAVGVMETSSADIAKVGLKGKGLKLLHHYPDMLWALGDKNTPDASFTPTRVFPQASPEDEGIARASPGDKGPAPSDESLPSGSNAQQGSLESETTALKLNGQADSRAPEAPSDSAALPLAQPEAAAEARAEAPDSMDAIVEGLLIAGLHNLEDDDLPVQTNEFYSKTVLGCKPPGVTVDIKKTSYKNLAKMLKAYEKKGLFGTKLVHKVDSLVSVNRQHELYSNNPHTSWLSPAHQNGTAADRSGAQASTSGSKADAAAPQAGQVTVSYWYRVPSTLRPILGSTTAPKDELYSEEQMQSALASYAAANDLQHSKGSLKLNKLMVGNLFNKKEPENEGDLCPLEDVLKRLLGKLQLFHKVTRLTEQGPIEVIKKGNIRNIQVAMEDRQGGRKHLTRITCVESFGFDADELAGILQRKFQTSSSVQKMPGKSETGKEIALQGPLLHEVPKFFTSMYGLSSSYIDVKSKGN